MGCGTGSCWQRSTPRRCRGGGSASPGPAFTRPPTRVARRRLQHGGAAVGAPARLGDGAGTQHVHAAGPQVGDGAGGVAALGQRGRRGEAGRARSMRAGARSSRRERPSGGAVIRLHRPSPPDRPAATRRPGPAPRRHSWAGSPHQSSGRRSHRHPLGPAEGRQRAQAGGAASAEPGAAPTAGGWCGQPECGSLSAGNTQALVRPCPPSAGTLAGEAHLPADGQRGLAGAHEGGHPARAGGHRRGAPLPQRAPHAASRLVLRTHAEPARSVGTLHVCTGQRAATPSWRLPRWETCMPVLSTRLGRPPRLGAAAASCTPSSLVPRPPHL